MNDEAIVIIPMGSVDTGVLGAVAAALKRTFHRPVAAGTEIQPDQAAFDSLRRQYRSDKLLDQLAEQAPPRARYVLGVIDADCYTPGLNFVFGQAEMPGRIALISLARLRDEFYGRKPVALLLGERAIKEAVHELGHAHGFRHCADSCCVMHFSNTLEDTDIKATGFCGRCTARFAKSRRTHAVRPMPGRESRTSQLL